LPPHIMSLKGLIWRKPSNLLSALPVINFDKSLWLM
jgi:hypothetical protein